MVRNVLDVAVFTALVAASGRAHASDNAVDPTNAGPTDARAPTESFDRQFLRQMLALEEGALEMAGIAVQRAEHPELRRLACDEVIALAAEVVRLRTWAAEVFGTEPIPTLASGMPELAARIDSLGHATPFDAAWLEAMLGNHQEVIALARSARPADLPPEWVDFANELQARRTARMRQLGELRTTWYPDGAKIAGFGNGVP